MQMTTMIAIAIFATVAGTTTYGLFRLGGVSRLFASCMAVVATCAAIVIGC